MGLDLVNAPAARVEARPVNKATDHPCAECDWLVRFKTEAELDAHVKTAHPYAIGRVKIKDLESNPTAGVKAPLTVTGEQVQHVSKLLAKHDRKGAPVATKPKTADPKTCKTCARYAPEKCHRHGGPAHSSSYRGKQSTTPEIKECKRCHRRNGTHTPRCTANKAPIVTFGRGLLAPVIRQLESEIASRTEKLKKVLALERELEA